MKVFSDCDQALTAQQAYLAMYAFLEKHMDRFKGVGLSPLMSDLLLPDGQSVDHSVVGDWVNAINFAQKGEVDAQFRLVPRIQ